MDLITELKRKQQKEPLIYESDRDGAIEDIITGEACPATELCPSCLFPSTPPTWALSGCFTASCFFFLPFSLCFFLLLPSPATPVLKTVPFTARTGKRTSRLLCEASLGEELPL